MQRRLGWIAKEDKKITEMWEAGEKVVVIACVLDRTDRAVRDRIRALGLPRRPVRAKFWTDVRDSLLIELWCSGVPLSGIAEKVGAANVKQVRSRMDNIRRVNPWLLPRRKRVNRVFNPMVADIQRIVAKAFKVTPNALVGPCRLSEITKPRHLAMALAKRMTDESFPSLAFYFNRKDHTTVLHACRKAENIWRDKLDELEARVRRNVFKEAAE